MSVVIGSVSQISGKVVAISPDGSERTLALGDPVYEDDLIKVSQDGSVEIDVNNAELVALESGQVWLVSSETFSVIDNIDPNEYAVNPEFLDAALAAEVAENAEDAVELAREEAAAAEEAGETFFDQANADAEAEAEAIQAAILAGVDPTEVGEATAAGGEPAAGDGGNEGSSTVNITRTAEEVDPTAGYETIGFEDTFEEPEEEELQPIIPPNNIPVITVNELGIDGTDDVVNEAGLPEGRNPEDDTEFAFGSFTISDADGLIGIQSVTINGVTTPIGELVGSSFDGDYGVMTITAYDSNTGIGSYQYELTSPVTTDPSVNDGANTELNKDTFSFTVSDGIDTSAPSAVTVDIIDDVPDAEVVSDREPELLILDESPLPEEGDGIYEVSIDFSAAFVGPAQYGADGPGSVSYAFILTGENVGTGLFALGEDGQQGAEIVLNMEGTNVVGTSGSGTEDDPLITHFTISVDNDFDSENFGTVTFTLENNIWHSDTDEHDEAETLNVHGSYFDEEQEEILNSLVLEQTITDADGDMDSASVDIGSGTFSIEDDGPTAQLRTPDEGEQPATLVLDESALDNGGINTVKEDFSVYFVTDSEGDDETGDLDVDYGTDGPGSVTYTLALSAAGLATQLYALDPNDTEIVDDPYGQGDEILLFMNEETGVVEGKTSAESETVYFSISVDENSGEVTFERYENIWHDNTGDHDDPESLQLDELATLKLTQTVEDADGDESAVSINLVGSDSDGDAVTSFTIEDDGPVGAGSNDNALHTGTVLVDTGTDGGTVAWSGSTSYGNFSGDADGVYNYSSTVDDADYPAGTVLSDTVSYTITDGDGDTTGGSLTFTYKVQNLEPEISVSGESTSLLLDESIGEDVNDENAEDDDAGESDPFIGSVNANLAPLFSYTIDDYGNQSDPGSATASESYGLSLTTESEDGFVETTLQRSSDNETVYLYQGEDGIVYGVTLDGEGEIDATVLSIEVDSDTATLTVNQYVAVEHGDAEDHDDSVSLNLVEETDLLEVTYLASYADEDGSPASDDTAFTLASVDVANISIEDDGPTAELSGDFNATLVLDESDVPEDMTTQTYVGPSLADLGNDEVAYAAALADWANYEVIDDGDDDGIHSVRASFAGAFATTDYGTDGEGDVTYALVLTGSDVESGLYELGVNGAQGDEIVLNQSGDDIIGASLDGTITYFTISVDVDSGEITFSQNNSNNIWHPTSPDNYDESVTLTVDGDNGETGDDLVLNSLVIEQTVTDADGDEATAEYDLGANVFSIEDDGPTADLSGDFNATLVLDESDVPEDMTTQTYVGPSLADLGNDEVAYAAALADSANYEVIDDGDDDGIHSVRASFAGAFATTDYGTDGEGDVTYALVLTGSDVESGLYELGVNGAQGDEIVLNQSGDDIIGTSLDGTITYFTISIDVDSGEITFSQNNSNNIWHPTSPDNYDESVTLTVDGDNGETGDDLVLNSLVVEQTVTDADGDEATAEYDLGANVFSIEDDGPTAELSGDFNATLVLDESDVPEDMTTQTYVGPSLADLGNDEVAYAAALADSANYEVIDDGDDDGIVSVSASFAGAFATTDYGTDGEGDVTYALVLTGSDVESGLYELGVNGAQGDEIVLNQSGDDIIGTSLDGTITYFTISIDVDSGEITFSQSNNVWHPTSPDNYDESVTLTVDGDNGETGDDLVLNSLVVEQTVTDADGDEATAEYDLGANVFSIEDDGPTAELSGDFNATLVLDESDVPEDMTTQTYVGPSLADLGNDEVAYAAALADSANYEVIDDGDDDGIVSVSASFAGAFATTDYGTDGEGDVTYALVLTGSDVESGLYELGVNGAQGDEIVLNQSGDDIIGTSLDGTITYFTISIDVDSGEITFSQSNNVWHPTSPDNYDESVTLTVDGDNGETGDDLVLNSLVVEQTVTDADGDEATAEYDLGANVFSIEDDGPTAELSGDFNATLVLDESDVPEDMTTQTYVGPSLADLGNDEVAYAAALADSANYEVIDDGDDDGIVSVSASFAGAFATTDYGTDGEGDVTYALVLTGSDVESGLYELGVNGAQGDEIVLNQSGDDIIGTSLDGTITYFTISIDVDSGEITFSQSNNVWHPTSPDNYDESVTLTVDGDNGETGDDLVLNSLVVEQTVTDADGDEATAEYDLGANVFSIEDDGPTAELSGDFNATLVLDESDVPEDMTTQTYVGPSLADLGNDEVAYAAALADSANYEVIDDGDDDGIVSVSASFAGAFATTDYGTDGEGDVTYALVLTGSDVESGLYELGVNGAQGDEIVLNQSGDDIIGTSLDGTITYFTISIDVDSGEITFSQSNNVWHPTSPDNYDESVTLTVDGDNGETGDDLVLNSLVVEQTVTDADGDEATAEYDLGANVFSIEDDGPTAELSGDFNATLVLDESDVPEDMTTQTYVGPSLADLGNDEVAYAAALADSANYEVIDDGDDDGIVSVSASFAGAFATTDYGTDGEGDVTYALVLTGTDVESGLYELGVNGAQGDEIVLNQSGDDIIGTSLDGTITYFTISIDVDSGEITFSQSNNVWHPTSPDNYDESVTLTVDGDNGETGDDLVLNSLVVEQTVTDADGDEATAEYDLGANVFSIEDDGPTAELSGDFNATLVLDESDVPEDMTTQTYVGPSLADLGNDEVAYAAALADSANYEVIDDGDDDGIVSVSASFAGAFATTDYGTDGEGDVTYALVLTGSDVESGLYELGVNGAQGDEIVLNQSGDDIIGTSLDGTITYFTISIDVDSGEITFSQSNNIWHPTSPDNYDESVTLTVDGDNGETGGDLVLNSLVVEQTVIDADGDEATAEYDLGANVFSIEDDGPTAELSGDFNATLVLDESDVPEDMTTQTYVGPSLADLGNDEVAYAAALADSANYEVIDDGDDDGIVSVSASFAGAFATTDYGTDGEGDVTYALVLTGTDVESGLYELGVNGAQGDEIVLNQSGDDIIGTSLDGTITYFTISIDVDSGEITFSQSNNVWHPTSPDNYDESVTLTVDGDNGETGDDLVLNSLVVEQTVTDADGDEATAEYDLGANVFSIEDDGPTAELSGDFNATLVLDESDVPEDMTTQTYVGPSLADLGNDEVAYAAALADSANYEVIDDGDDDGIVSVSASFAGAFATTDYGTDGEGDVTYALVLTGTDVESGLYELGVNGAQGDEIVLNQSGDDIIGTSLDGTITYFTISIDVDSGEITFSQSNNVWHPTSPDNYDESVTLTVDGDNGETGDDLVLNSLVVEQTVTDADGDEATAEYDLGANVFSIEDDGPSEFHPDKAHVILDVSSDSFTEQEITQTLNFDPGTDGLGDLTFNIQNGQLFKDSEGNQLFLDNKELYLYYGENEGELIARTSDEDGAVVAFTATIDAEGNVNVTIFSGQFISNVEITTVTDLSGVGGGNVPFKGLNIGSNNTPDPDGSDDVLVSSEILPLGDADAGTVNSNSTVLGVGTGNEVSDGEIIRYDLVTDLSINDQQNQESYSFSGYQETFVFKQQIRIDGGSKDADFILRIYKETGDAVTQNNTLVQGSGVASMLALTVAEVRIYNDLNQLQDNTAYVTQNIDGSVTVHDLQDGWWFEIVSLDDFNEPEAFNAVEIQAIEYDTLDAEDDVTSFKLAQFTFGQDSDIEPVNFELPVEGIDADGDTVSSAVDITVYPDTQSVVGTSDADELVGTDQGDYLFGYEGNDILTGGLGDDVFMWLDGDADGGTDTVIDFTYDLVDPAAENDVLNLADMLDPTGVLDFTGGADNIDDYLVATFDDVEGTTTLEVYLGGDANSGGTVDQTIIVNGDLQTTLDTLLANGNIDVDQ
ncbi:retention module-containing protein [Neptuniibacter sp. QD29_5]|uniref:retention module-containing protein n=1 Tax=Neptuniibacter sp. QD29_5 TaxID=3398207 RepID=UPI0039F554DB